MDAIKGFFRKYNAVRGDERGPDWTTASEEALLGWFNKTAPIVRCGWNPEAGREATAAERLGNAPIYQALVAEIRRRLALPNPSAEIVAAWATAEAPFPVPLPATAAEAPAPSPPPAPANPLPRIRRTPDGGMIFEEPARPRRRRGGR